MSELIDKAASSAGAALKKIKASKGSLLGNFYFAGDTQGRAGGLVVTLTARDPKGSKAVTEGKAIRKALKGARFARGTVIMRGSKLLFEVHSGSASPSNVLLSFKKAISELEGLGFIKKAIVKQAGSDTDTETETESEPTSAVPAAVAGLEDVDDILDGIDEDELKALLAEQDELGDLNDQLAGFLSEEASEAERGEQIADALDNITALESADASGRELAQARRALAEVLYTGAEPFPEPGQPLSPDVQELLNLSMAAAVRSLDAYLRSVADEIAQLHAKISAMSEEERGQAREELRPLLAQHRRSVTSYHSQLQQNILA